MTNLLRRNKEFFYKIEKKWKFLFKTPSFSPPL
jgi:hypothetical protein